MNSNQHPKKEKTFVMIKPDGVQRGLVGEIIQRFERIGLKIVAMKMIVAKEEQCWEHYKKDDAWYIKIGNRIIENRKNQSKEIEKDNIEYGKDIIRGLVKFMTASPLVALIIEGNNSQAIVKRLVGSTEPATADTGTIRGDFTIDSYFLCDTDGSRAMRNLIHCTDPADGEDAAEREINIWFNKDEIINWNSINERILYDVNLDGHLN